MNRETARKALIVMYAVMALCTYGHAFNRGYESEFCQIGGGAGACAAIMVAPASAAVWPLYWSVRLMP